MQEIQSRVVKMEYINWRLLHFLQDDDFKQWIDRGDEKHLSHLELKDRIRSNVWRYPSGASRANPEHDMIKNHPTPKPVSMIADSILDTTYKGDLVIDWFSGSGTCLMACEKTERFARVTEIEPLYVQLAISRYLNYCKKVGKSVKFNHENGVLTENDFYGRDN